MSFLPDDAIASKAVESGVPGVLATVTGVDLTVTGTTNLYTVPAGKTAVIEGIDIVGEAFSGAPPDQPSVRVGSQAGEREIIDEKIIVGLDAADEQYTIAADDSARPAKAAEVIKLGHVRSVDATYDVTVVLRGYLR